jgi:predicted nucleic acid-binding protein
LTCEPITVTRTIRACRDPRGDTFLELAMAGGANLIVSGDGHLLAFQPLEDIAIATPARFLMTRPE